jgi:hypothetical protein
MASHVSPLYVCDTCTLNQQMRSSNSLLVYSAAPTFFDINTSSSGSFSVAC